MFVKNVQQELVFEQWNNFPLFCPPQSKQCITVYHDFKPIQPKSEPMMVSLLDIKTWQSLYFRGNMSYAKQLSFNLYSIELSDIIDLSHLKMLT